MFNTDWTIFGDESMRPGRYLLTGVLMPTRLCGNSRATLRKLCRPGQRQIHAKSESPASRRRLLRELDPLGIEAATHVAQGPPSHSWRARCLASMVEKLPTNGTSLLVLEHRDPASDAEDRRVLAMLRGHTDVEFRYMHANPVDEPLLWLPDLVGWCIGRGNGWPAQLPASCRNVYEASSWP